MPVAMELSRIIISEINDQQVIYLREIDGERTFPILIGIFEATSIDRHVRGVETPRPSDRVILIIVGQLPQWLPARPATAGTDFHSC